MEAAGEMALRERQFRGRQMRTAFVFLIYNRLRTVSRDELASVVWPDDTPPAWESGLSALLSKLRAIFLALPLPDRPFLTNGFAQYQVHLPDAAWVDLECASASIDRAEVAIAMLIRVPPLSPLLLRFASSIALPGKRPGSKNAAEAQPSADTVMVTLRSVAAIGSPLLSRRRRTTSFRADKRRAHRLLMQSPRNRQPNQEAFSIPPTPARCCRSHRRPSPETERPYAELL
jgi:hypothetical protein